MDPARIDYRYNGVGGWLMFFIITLVFLGPLGTCSSLGRYDSEWGSLYQAYPFIRTIKWINMVLGIGLVCFGVYAGISLWRIRPNAVEIAKTYLVLAALIGTTLISLPFLAGLPEEANVAMLKATPIAILPVLVYSTVWFLYLTKSKRVATTFKVKEMKSQLGVDDSPVKL